MRVQGHNIQISKMGSNLDIQFMFNIMLKVKTGSSMQNPCYILPKASKIFQVFIGNCTTRGELLLNAEKGREKTCLQGTSRPAHCRWLISLASSSLSPAGGNCEAGSQPGLDNLHPRYYYIFSTLFLRFNFTEDQWAVGGFKTLESKSCTILLKVDLKMYFL